MLPYIPYSLKVWGQQDLFFQRTEYI